MNIYRCYIPDVWNRYDMEATSQARYGDDYDKDFPLESNFVGTRGQVKKQYQDWMIEFWDLEVDWRDIERR